MEKDPAAFVAGGQGSSPTASFESDEDRGGIAVAVKWTGTDADRNDMVMLGRKQVLRRNFQFMPMVGFAAVLIATWELLFVNLLFNLTDGGTAGIFWGFTIVVIASIFIYLSIGELASMSPTAGGQYHWVSEFAPPSCQKFLSYLTGWVIATGWQGSVVGLSFSAGTIIQALIGFNNDKYKPQQWHGTLLVIAAVMFAIVFNTLTAKHLPIIQLILLVLHITGAFALTIPVLVLAPEKNDAHTALLDFTNSGGWPTKGLSTMIGLLTSLSSMLGFDCAVHMSEEIQNASTTLPRAIFASVTINIILGYLTILTLCFTIRDPAALLESDSTYPFIQLFSETTGSKGGTNAMVAIIVITLVSAVIAEIATASRQIWSFSRDGGFPFSRFLSKVPPNHPIPINALLVSFLCGVAISLINLGSSVALNAIVSLTISALLGSYILSIGCVFYRRVFSPHPLPPCKWSLERKLGWGVSLGVVVNGVSLGFLVVFFVFCFFPTRTPVDRETMNWNVVMFGGIVIFATVWYVFRGRHVYRPPVRIVKRDL